MLQWGTAGAAILIIWCTPTTGLGCRSLILFIYAGTSTLIWAMLVTSSMLTHSPHLVVWLRRVGKALACGNGALIITSGTLQFANVFDRCYCNSSILGGKTYDVLLTSFKDVKGPWVGGLGLACGCVIIFLVFVFICARISEPANRRNTRTAPNAGTMLPVFTAPDIHTQRASSSTQVV
jgi:hypothetical protein